MDSHLKQLQQALQEAMGSLFAEELSWRLSRN